MVWPNGKNKDTFSLHETFELLARLSFLYTGKSQKCSSVLLRRIVVRGDRPTTGKMCNRCKSAYGNVGFYVQSIISLWEQSWETAIKVPSI